MLPRKFIKTIVKEMSKGKRMISDIYVKILIVKFTLKQLCHTSLTFFSVLSFLVTFTIKSQSSEEVWYNCRGHCSAHLFKVQISSNSHIKLKQAETIFLQYNCSATMINIVKKYLWIQILELNTLIRFSDILIHKHRINILSKLSVTV